MQLQAKMCALALYFCYVIVLWSNLFWNGRKCSIRVTIYIAVHQATKICFTSLYKLRLEYIQSLIQHMYIFNYFCCHYKENLVKAYKNQQTGIFIKGMKEIHCFKSSLFMQWLVQFCGGSSFYGCIVRVCFVFLPISFFHKLCMIFCHSSTNLTKCALSLVHRQKICQCRAVAEMHSILSHYLHVADAMNEYTTTKIT